MSVSSTSLSVRYVGNGSAVTQYVIPFPFMDKAHIIASVSSNGVVAPVELSGSAYVVTRDEDGQGGTVRTVAAVTTPAEIVIERVMPIVQPTEFENAGPFPAESAETALDRITMLLQQIDAKVDTLTGDESLVVINGDSVLIWADATARAAVKPGKTGQLGVQKSDQSLWIAQSIALGDWAIAVPARKLSYYFQLYRDSEDLPLSTETGRWIGHFPIAGTLSRATLCVSAQSSNRSYNFVIKAAGTSVATGTLANLTTFISVAATASVAAGAKLTLDLTPVDSASGTAEAPVGLLVTLIFTAS